MVCGLTPVSAATGVFAGAGLGATTRPGVDSGGIDGCTTQLFPSEPPADVCSRPDVFDVAIGPNGDVYTAAYGGQRIGIFSAAADGTLTPKGGAFGCLAT